MIPRPRSFEGERGSEGEMIQTRAMSAVEAAFSTTIGFVLSWALAVFLYPLCGIVGTPGQTLAVTIAFTVLSVVRSYAVRRLFERVRRPAIVQ